MMSKAENKSITVGEFRCWLQGVEEMQEEGWTPNPTQWKRIREKLDLIQDAPAAPQRQPTQHTEAVAFPPGFPIPPMYAQNPNQPPPAVPAGPSSLSVSQPVRPPSRQVHSVNGLPISLATNEKSTVKTPDIDTSGKEYNSQFV